MSIESESAKLEKRLDLLLRIVIGAFVIVILSYVIIRVNLWPGIPSNWFRGEGPSPSTLGTFGDFVGGTLNPLVSLFAFYLLSKSIRIQQKEFSKTNEALVASHSTQIEQSRTLEIQRFENTFFSMLGQHNEVLQQLADTKVGESGDYSRLMLVHGRTFRESAANSARLLLQANPTCGHYFRILYQILKYIAMKCPETSLKGDFSVESLANSTASSTEKFYSNIVRAFIDTRVSQLLAANCHINTRGEGYHEYRELVERYAMLEHMPFVVVANADRNFILRDVASSYSIRSFGESQFLTEEIKTKLRPNDPK